MDPDVAKLWRWIVLPFATIAAFVAFVLMPLVPVAPELPSATEHIFRLSPLGVAAVLTYVAAWLRTREADPVCEGQSRASVFRQFVLYGMGEIALCLIGIAVLHR